MTTGLVKVGLGDNAKLSYLVQAASGAIGATPAWTVLPFTSAEYSVQAEQLADNSMTGDRNELAPRTGTVAASVSVSGKFRPECLDKIIEAAAQGTWAVKFNVALGAGTTVDVNATAKTFTRSTGSWLTDGVEIGDIVKFSGFTVTGPPDETPNNGSFLVSNVNATVITCATATTLVNTAAPQASVTITTETDYVKVGSTRRAVAWEVHHTDAGTAGEYIRIINTEIASFNISLAPNGDVTFQIEAVGGQELDLGAAIATMIAGATYTETTAPFYDSFNGTVSLDGSTGIYFSSMNPSINNQSTPLLALGSRYPFAVAHGKMMGDMSLTAFYTDETIKAKYQDETTLDLKIQVKYEDATLINTDFHEFTYPSCKITSFGRPIGGSGELVDNLTVKPFKNTALASSFRIRKFNAV